MLIKFTNNQVVRDTYLYSRSGLRISLFEDEGTCVGFSESIDVLQLPPLDSGSNGVFVRRTESTAMRRCASLVQLIFCKFIRFELRSVANWLFQNLESRFG